MARSSMGKKSNRQMHTAKPTAEPSPPQSSAGFPIASLALLITTCACLLASADIKRLQEQYLFLSGGGSWWFIILVAAAGLIGGSIGLISIFFSHANWRVRLLAPAAGM